MATPQERIEIYKKSPEIIQHLYDLPESGEKMRNVFSKYIQDSDLYITYGNIVGDTILGFYKIADLPQLLQKQVGVSADDSQRITSELIEFLSPVVEREEQEAAQKKEEMNSLADTFATRKSDEVTPAQEQTESIQPIHTMNSDGNRVHGYGSLPQNQDAEPVVKAISQEETFQKKSEE